MNRYLQVFILSMIPVIEQRGSIPLGFIYGLEPWIIFLLALAGSLLPAPFILLLFHKIYNILVEIPFFDRLVKLIDQKIAKNKGNLEKRKELGLIIFVAIPLPTTGVWTGSAVAAFLGLDFKKSMLCILAGAILSATIITLISMFLPGFFHAKTLF